MKITITQPSAKRHAASDLRTPIQQDISLKNDGFASGWKAGNNADCESTVFYRCLLVVSGSAGDLPYSGFLRRCISERATSTRRLISSLALVPMASTCSRASRDDSSGFSVAPSVCRLAISLRMAATMNPALLSSGFFNVSIPSITSCGMRIEICFDLSLTVFFAMSVYLFIKCDSVYTKIKSQKALTCDSVEFNLNHTSALGCDSERQRPASAGTRAGRLTINERSKR